MAILEAQIDFSDVEDADALSLDAARAVAAEAARRLRAALAGAEAGARLREGFNVVIAGPPNVGKSTLMNALARRDVSIVSAIPGTTRDLVEVSLELRGYPVTLVDTAGIRDTDDPIEREGVARARRRAEEADLTLWLSDGADERAAAARRRRADDRRADQGRPSPGARGSATASARRAAQHFRSDRRRDRAPCLTPSPISPKSGWRGRRRR